MKNWTFKVIMTGKTQYGQWALGDLSDDIILYNGIVQLAKEMPLEKDKIYQVKTIDVKQNKNKQLIIKIGL